MDELNRVLTDNLAAVLIVMAVAIVVLLVLVILQSIRVGRAVDGYRRLVRDGSGGSLDDVLQAHVARVEEVRGRLGEIDGVQATLEHRTQTSIQHIGLIRFNPFDDTGSDQSFALAHARRPARRGGDLQPARAHQHAALRQAGRRRHLQPRAVGRGGPGDPGGHGRDERQSRLTCPPIPREPILGRSTQRQRRIAERRVTHALQRIHRREPMAADIRVDTVVAAVRAAPRPAAGHRGSTPLALDDAAVRQVIDGMVEAGALVRSGHRVRLPNHRPGLDPVMRERADRLLDGLREAGAEPPRVEALAARLGITPAVLAQLRQSGELVAIGSGVDYPRDLWESIEARVDRVAERGPLTVARLRDGLRTSRRHAEAILAFRRAERRRLRPGRRAG